MPAEVTIIVCWCVCLCVMAFIYVWCRMQNAKKARIRADPSYTKSVQSAIMLVNIMLMKARRLENQEWLDLTDKVCFEILSRIVKYNTVLTSCCRRTLSSCTLCRSPCSYIASGWIRDACRLLPWNGVRGGCCNSAFRAVLLLTRLPWPKQTVHTRVAGVFLVAVCILALTKSSFRSPYRSLDSLIYQFQQVLQSVLFFCLHAIIYFGSSFTHIAVAQIIVRLSWFLRFVELYRIVDVAQHRSHTILILHIQLQE